MTKKFPSNRLEQSDLFKPIHQHSRCNGAIIKIIIKIMIIILIYMMIIIIIIMIILIIKVTSSNPPINTKSAIQQSFSASLVIMIIRMIIRMIIMMIRIMLMMTIYANQKTRGSLGWGWSGTQGGGGRVGMERWDTWLLSLSLLPLLLWSLLSLYDHDHGDQENLKAKNLLANDLWYSMSGGEMNQWILCQSDLLLDWGGVCIPLEERTNHQ